MFRLPMLPTIPPANTLPRGGAEKRNILELNPFRPQRVSNCSAAWSRTRSKEQRLSPKPKYAPAILPCYERQRRRDVRQPPCRLDRLRAGLLVGPLDVV